MKIDITPEAWAFLTSGAGRPWPVSAIQADIAIRADAIKRGAPVLGSGMLAARWGVSVAKAIELLQPPPAPKAKPKAKKRTRGKASK